MDLGLDYKPEKVIDTLGMPEKDWLEYRKKGLGGSDVSALFGVNPWTTRRGLYYDKIGMSKMDPKNQYSLDFGHAVEPFVANWFQYGYDHNPDKYKAWLEQRLGTELKSFHIYKDTWMYRHPLYPFLQSNLDYRFHAAGVDGKPYDGIFECKTTNTHSFLDKWSKNHWGWNSVPEYYEWQCREYMCVMNLDYTIIACVAGNNEDDFAMAFVKRDLNKEEELIDTAKDFWENNVQKQVPPPLAEDEAHADTEWNTLIEYGMIGSPQNEEHPVVLNPSLLETAKREYELGKEISALNKKARQLAAKKELIDTQLAYALNGKRIGIVENSDVKTKYEIRVCTTERETVNKKLIEELNPGFLKRYLKKSVSQHVKVKPKAANT